MSRAGRRSRPVWLSGRCNLFGTSRRQRWPNVFAALVAVALAAPALGFESAGRQPANAQEQARLQHIENLRATHGLHAAALASAGKHYVGFEMIDGDLVAADLETVAFQSDVVVRGRMGSNLKRIAKDARGKETVVLDYWVEVQEVIKGPSTLVAGGVILTVPGGVYRFTDEASVEIVTPAFRKPRTGEEYVLFLRAGKTFGNHQLAWGTQALFLLHQDGRVESGASRSYPTGEGVLADSRDAFLETVKKSARPRVR